jgi:hypothetical protein
MNRHQDLFPAIVLSAAVNSPSAASVFMVVRCPQSSACPKTCLANPQSRILPGLDRSQKYLQALYQDG